MADLNALRDKVLGSMDTIAGKTKNVAGTVATKAKNTAAIAKLNGKVASQKNLIKKNYTELGRIYFDQNQHAPGEDYAQLCSEVTLAYERIAELEKQISDIKASGDYDVEVDFDEVVLNDDDTDEDTDAATCSAEDFAPTEEESTEEAPKAE